MEIPALHSDRTVGTHVGSMGRERENRYKRGRGRKGKPVLQPEYVMWSEIIVAKHAGHVPRKAAIAHYVPVP